MNFTYEDLGQNLRSHFGLVSESPGDQADKSSVQQYRNHLSTLNSYLASVGKTSQSRVGVELGSTFESSLKNYLSVIDVAPRTKRDRINHLKLIRRLYDALRRPTDAAPRATLLSAELRTQIARTGVAPKTLAREAGLSTSAMQRWLKGALPNKRGIPTLRRLEAALKLPRDHLVDLVDERPCPPPPPAQNIAYRSTLASRVADTYALPETSMSPALVAQWRAWFDYKTSVSTDLERSAKGQWRCVPLDKVVGVTKLAQLGASGCPTAALQLQKLRQFLGFLSLAPERGGWGLPAEEAQSLAWFAHPQAVEAFLNFLKHRSNDLMHTGHRTFCQLVASLVRENCGYLWQQPELAASLPEAYRPLDATAWHRLCARTHKLVTAWKKQSRDVSRRPGEPIAHLLELDEPLAPLLNAISAIERAAAATPNGSISEALLMRDACLLTMLLWNPLRVSNWQTLTWRPDNTGSVYCTGTGSWHIRLTAQELKNGGSDRTYCYDVDVPDRIVPKLTAYLEEHRATLLKGRSSPYLFIGSRSPGIWKNLDLRVAQLTARFVPGSPGIRPHAFRHLVATAFLRENPGAFELVAEILNDELDTVLKAYAHLRRNSSFARHEAHITRLLQN